LNSQTQREWFRLGFVSQSAHRRHSCQRGAHLIVKKKDIENHKKWMIRCFGALFGSFFFWRIEALVLQWMFSSATGWLFCMLNTWLLGMLLFDYAARKSGFYAAKTPKLDIVIS
jgi:hypothetical protein